MAGIPAFDDFGNLVGEFIPAEDGDGCLGCLIGPIIALVVLLAVGILVGPAIVAYLVVKLLVGDGDSGFSGKALAVSALVGVIWIVGGLSVIGSEPQVPTNQLTVAQQQASQLSKNDQPQTPQTVQGEQSREISAPDRIREKLSLLPQKPVTVTTAFGYPWFPSEQNYKHYLRARQEKPSDYASRMNTGVGAKQINQAGVVGVISSELIKSLGEVDSQDKFEVRVRLSPEGKFRKGTYEILHSENGSKRVVGVGPIKQIKTFSTEYMVMKRYPETVYVTDYTIEAITFGPTAPK
jgi:hypothetical protein